MGVDAIGRDRLVEMIHASQLNLAHVGQSVFGDLIDMALAGRLREVNDAIDSVIPDDSGGEGASVRSILSGIAVACAMLNTPDDQEPFDPNTTAVLLSESVDEIFRESERPDHLIHEQTHFALLRAIQDKAEHADSPQELYTLTQTYQALFLLWFGREEDRPPEGG